MPPRQGLTRERLVDFAAELVDRGGPSALSLAAVAKHFGVRPPSLYNHVSGLDGLQRELRLRGLRGVAREIGRAAIGRSGSEALRAVAHAYRRYAGEHPGLYALAQRGSTGGDEEVTVAAEAVLEVILGTLRGYGLKGEDALHATRFLRSVLHGFLSLEANEGFALSLDRDESFERSLDAVDRGLVAMARSEANGEGRADAPEPASSR